MTPHPTTDPTADSTTDPTADLPERPVDPDWLALREPADARSRDSAAETVVTPLLDCLRERLERRAPEHGLRVVDLGAGTGANARWLAPRLATLGGAAAPAAQRWLLVDHDPRLQAWGPVQTTTVRADVADLPHLLGGGTHPSTGTDLVTATALLDLLDRPQLTAVVDAVVGHGVPALFALSVTGSVVLDPADPLDAPLADAFDAHQRRDGRLGPDAGTEAAEQFRRRGWNVVVADTPWQLGAEPAALIEEWMLGRVEAAVEWDASLDAPARAWLDRRRAQVAAGTVNAVVGHVDVLALPIGPQDRRLP